MTSQSPRIYLYKITFEEVSYYYYGIHKEKKFGEYYMGSPVTHKWMWDFYTPKKQILEIFPFTDEGWVEAQEVEKRIIKPFYNIDKWCLNEHCGGNISLQLMRKTGNKIKELNLGIFGLSTEERKENSKKTYKRCKEEGIGLFSISLEQRAEMSNKANQTNKENKSGIYSLTPEKRKQIDLFCKENEIGIYGLTPEEMTENAKKGGNKVKELGVGIHGLTKEQMTKNSKRAGKITSSQRWMCLETGFISSPGGLGRYQKARGIDNSKRKRIS